LGKHSALDAQRIDKTNPRSYSQIMAASIWNN